MRALRRSALVISLVLHAVDRTPVDAQRPALPSAAEVAKLAESLVAQFMAADGPSAVSIAVVRNGEPLVRRGWGLADRGNKIGATADTTYRIGSITKQFTAAAVLRLVERRRVALTEAIGRYLPQLPKAWSDVTIGQLLNHTSGIPDFTEIGGRWSRHWGEPMTPASLIALVARDRMSFVPGSAWQYSNTGYVVLGLLIEQLYGRPYAEVVQAELAGPLGLAHTRACEDPAGANGQALGYRRDGRSFDAAGYRHVSHWFGGGGLCSTVDDLAAWNRAIHGGRVLDLTSYALMTTPRGPAAKNGYGFGLMARALSGHRELTHSGQFAGFSAINVWYPDESLSVTVLTNTAPMPTKDALARNLALVALGAPVTISEPIGGPAPDPSMLGRYAGQYSIQVPGRPSLGLRVWVDGRTLRAQADRQRAFPLHATGRHTFGTAIDPSVRFVFVVEDEVVTGLVFEQAGVKYETVKKR